MHILTVRNTVLRVDTGMYSVPDGPTQAIMDLIFFAYTCHKKATKESFRFDSYLPKYLCADL